jgi:iron(III) transport system ATP-binding protein
MAILEAKNISKSFNQKQVLNDVSLSLKQGEVLVVIGRSGEGKSTLLKILAGLSDADDGTVFFKGKQVVGPSQRLLAGHPEIKLVNQDFALDLYHTVAENIRIKILHHTQQVINEITDELLEVLGLKSLQDQKAHLLSGGEQQRLALARTLATEPDVILLDEPFVHLDPPTRRRVESYLHAMKQRWQSSIILVTHDGNEAMSWGDRIAYMEGGAIQRIDKPEAFFNHPRNITEAAFFGDINTVVCNGKEILFRPNHYVIATNEYDGLNITITKSIFQGIHFVNFAKAESGELIVIYSPHELSGSLTIKVGYARD